MILADIDPRENLKHERQIVLPPQYNSRSQMFGVPLERLMGDDGLSSGIPRAVKDCVEDIRARGRLHSYAYSIDDSTSQHTWL